jgi:diaminopimelate epimerase
MRFTKLHALGNDFLVVGRDEAAEYPYPGAFARRINDRHTGVGADGLILLSPGEGGAGRFLFRIFNVDGSEAEISGNGLRCATAFLAHEGKLASTKVHFKTAAGERDCEIVSSRGAVYDIKTGLGAPRLEAADIPFDDGRQSGPVIDYPLVISRKVYPATCVSMGNPHCGLFFGNFPSRLEWHQIGGEIESHPFFPKRTNVEFIRVLGRGDIEVKFWERGVGETLASGTGSAAAAAASMVKGLVDRTVMVRTDRGSLIVDWPEGGELLQTGPAEVVFTGDYPEA